MAKTNKKFILEVNERQLGLLEGACELYARLLMGQLSLGRFQDICEEAWCKSHKSKIGDPDWFEMRQNLERTLNQIKFDHWKFSPGQSGGVGFNDQGDIYWDMYQCMRHARFLSFDEKTKETMRWTVMADKPHRWGEEPLITIKEKKDANIQM